jgi:hypothetical protein
MALKTSRCERAKIKEPSEVRLRRGKFSGSQKDVLHVAKALKDIQTC